MNYDNIASNILFALKNSNVISNEYREQLYLLRPGIAKIIRDNKMYDNFDETITIKEKEWGVIKNLHAWSPFLDRVIILKDPEESKYACKNCKGRGYTDETCERCLGTGREKRRKGEDEESCRECTIKGVLDRAYGKVICPVCKGQGAWLTKPDNSKGKTLTGKVLATGPKCEFVIQNMRVMFTNYTGIDFVVDGVEMMYCSEKDLIGEYKQLVDSKTNQKGTTDQIGEKTHEELAEIGVDSNPTTYASGKFTG